MARKSSNKSRLEIDLKYQILDHGFPEPDEEVDFHNERKWRFDFAWPELMIAVEVEGGIYNQGRHSRPRGYESDCIKYSTASIMGWTVIRATPGMIKDGTAIKLISMAFEKFYENEI
jgi:hypothetical protein